MRDNYQRPFALGKYSTRTWVFVWELFYFMENTGQIVRSKKTGKSRYTPISNEILQSKSLTPEEKSILVHLLSLPEDWVVYKTLIWQDMNMGKHRFNSNWKTLVEKGFIVSVRVIDSQTNLVRGWNHIVYEEPVLSGHRTIQSSDLPVFGQSEEQGLNKVHIPQKNKKTKEKEEIQFDLPTEWHPVLMEWLSYKKQKKKSYTEIGLNKLVAKIKSDYTSLKHFEDSVNNCIAQNYDGLFPMKLVHLQESTNNTHKQPTVYNPKNYE